MTPLRQRFNYVQVAAFVVTLALVGFLFLRQEMTINNDNEESRRADIELCEGGRQLAEGQTRNINQLADLAILVTDTPQERDAVNRIRNDQLANVPTFDCDNLPKP